MNLQQLNRILTGSFLPTQTNQSTGDVEGWRIPLASDEGGTIAIKRRNPECAQRRVDHLIIPGFSDGRSWTGRKKKKTKYKNERERKAHDLIVDRHVGIKRLLDLEPAHQQQKEQITSFLAEKLAGFGGPTGKIQPGKRRRTVGPSTEEEKVAETPVKHEIVPEIDVSVKKDEPEEKTSPIQPSPDRKSVV